MDSDIEIMSAENGEFPCGPKDMSLDVKLAFNRVCMMIDSLDDSDESMNLLRKIQREARFLVRKRRNEIEKQNLNESQFTNVSVAARTSERNSERAIFSRPNEQTNLNNSSFFLADSRILHTSVTEPKSFRPISKKGTHGVVHLGSIPEINEPVREEVGSDSLSSASSGYEPSLDERTTYLLRHWSIKKRNNDLYVTGVKIDKKGNIIEKDFISDKILSRPECDLLRTEDCDFLLQEPISDPRRSIPDEVRNIFEKESYFPKNWRKALELWNKLETKSIKEKKKNESKAEKEKKKPENKADKEKKTKNKADESQLQSKKKPDGKKNTPVENNRKTPAEHKKSTLAENKKNTPAENKKNTPAENKKNTPAESKKNTPAENKKNTPAEKQMKTQKSDKSIPQKQRKKNPPKEKKKPISSGMKALSGSGDAPRDDAKKTQKKNKPVQPAVTVPDEEEKEEENDSIFTLNPSSKEAGNNERFPPGLDGDSMFLLPQTSLTPSGLLNSIKKTNVKGRFTPPTDLFDNIYGQTQSSNNSFTNTSPGSFTNKNSNVVKRMAKAKSNTKGQKLRERDYVPLDYEEDEIVSEVLRVAGTNPATTPPLLKEVFRANENSEDSEIDSD